MQQFIKSSVIAFNIMYALEGSTDKPVQDDFSTLPITTNEYLWYNNFLLGLLSK